VAIERPLPSPGFPPLAVRLETERLVLRTPRTGDVAELRRRLRKNAAHLRPWTPEPRPGEDPTSLTALSKAVARERREWKRGDAFVLLATPRGKEDAIVGRIRFGGVMRGAFLNAYLGYWIDAEHEGRGLMTEAVTAAVDFAFTVVGLHRIQAAVMPRNAASTRVVEKVGFRREGYAERYLAIAGKWEDHLIFALTAEEWPVRRS
jgi:[ribosomal protein S5]-alanine N-acetyltransferase